jgi:inosine-uridine nucleoside N-ribohydrolase
MRTILAAVVMLGLLAGCAQQDESTEGSASETEQHGLHKMPVVLDTDIGTDIDDTWALALLLNSPRLDLQLVATDSGNTRERARIAAKYLDEAGRGDVPVAIGRSFDENPLPQSPWAGDYQLSSHRGKVYENGVTALVDAIMNSPEPVVLIVIGPASNIADALRQEPAIAQKARVVAMSGSVDVGYGDKPQPDAEYNVKTDPAATRAMYAAGWDVLLAPLDTCGTIQLKGGLYQRVHTSSKPSLLALMENYRTWSTRENWTKVDPAVESSTLFDTLAVALVVDQSWVDVEELKLEVTGDGYTRRSPQGSSVRAALRWKDLNAYQQWLVDSLTR